MARTTKIPCAGVIYTVHKDTYGTTIETDEVVEVLPDEPVVTDERARYAQVLAELDELEEALTQAEEQVARAEQFNDRSAAEDESTSTLL